MLYSLLHPLTQFLEAQKQFEKIPAIRDFLLEIINFSSENLLNLPHPPLDIKGYDVSPPHIHWMLKYQINKLQPSFFNIMNDLSLPNRERVDITYQVEYLISECVGVGEV